MKWFQLVPTNFQDESLGQSSKMAASFSFDDPRRLEKIDKLIEIGVGEYISLPQLVVVGDQSSGKSSVLEGLTELPFPRDSTLCTRFATRIVFRRAREERISVSILPAASSDATRTQRLKDTRWKDMTALSMETFREILSSACQSMGVPAPGQIPNQDVNTPQSAFSEDILQIELTGPERSHFSVIDVPGIFRSPTPGVTTKADIAMVERMVRRFIKDSRTIILAVLPANVDIATQEILELAEEVDPKGIRTLGVLTKPDLIEPGTEKDVIELLEGQKKPLKLGYCVVRNRKQQEKNASPEERHKAEADFFKSEPFNTITPDRTGIPALHRRLQALLRQITRQEFPLVRREIDKRLENKTTQLKTMGPSRQTEHEQRAYLMDLATNYQDAVSCGIAADYNRNEYFREEESVRIATCLVDLNCKFEKDVATRGQIVSFDRQTSDESGESDGGSSGKDEDAAHGDSEEFETKEEAESTDAYFPIGDEDDERNGLFDIQPELESDERDILEWLTEEYRKSRGFELGTFNPSIIPTIFNKLTENWKPITQGYIYKAICTVHKFSREVLRHYAADERVQTALWETLSEDFKQQYHKAFDQATFLLHIERSGTLMTTNHYFAQTMEAATRKRYDALVQKHQDQHEYKDEYRRDRTITTFNAASFLDATRLSNDEHTVQTIHDVLHAYYKVARKRFVDYVCMQAADYHLVSGPAASLRRFAPRYVLGLSAARLEAIAGEDPVAVERRLALGREIESLRKGKEILAG